MPRQTANTFDLVTAGRAVVDLYPGQDGLAPKDVLSYTQFLGGSPTNVAVAAARAGLRTAAVTRTGDDLFHQFVVARLEAYGVDTRWVRAVADTRTTLAVADLQEPHAPALQFFRDPRPPENDIYPDELAAAAASADTLWLTASGFAADPSAAAHAAALRERRRCLLDLDYRPAFWADARDFHLRLRSVLPHVDTVIGNEQECALALGSSGTPTELARRLLAQGPALAIVKLGADGALAATSAGVIRQPAFRAEVVNGLGAGDAFGGFIAKGLIEGWPLERSLRFACAAGSIVASRRGCSDAMPTETEVAGLAG
ncbi:5-dehydro-2-deoxygluconokinase [Occultella glacieicola]|uniref:5-dehydro-2-deoxygluconokinase n=1 Tax=Occultella glacieicola TaxID=2518684 RepID=A0ABY2E767_9MICO|nr:PfkB family carbohydrate kinase [Occultella glacieicola]TDE97400.1 5-dehydro-2-deoxygluconokinase [Occultella glacieicola]